MLARNILLHIFIPFLLLFLCPLGAYSALTEEGIYRIEYDKVMVRYFVANNEVAPEVFLQSLQNIQCNESGESKRVPVMVVMPLYDYRGKQINGTTMKVVWIVEMPGSINLQQAPGFMNRSGKYLGNSISCPQR